MKAIVTIAALCLGCLSVSAQKYMTRTGKVTFFSSTAIENIEAYNNETAAVIDASSGEVVIIVPIKSFKFEKALMQEHFNENYMESDQFPKADFKGKITNPSAVNFQKDGTYKVEAKGKLTMHGVTKDITAPGTITVKGGKATLSSKINVAPADYKIKIPSVAASKIAQKIEVTINCELAKK